MSYKYIKAVENGRTNYTDGLWYADTLEDRNGILAENNLEFGDKVLVIVDSANENDSTVYMYRGNNTWKAL